MGGAPLSAELIQQWEALGARFLHGYGLTPAIVDLARVNEPQVLVTVDNGIASLAGVA